MINYSKVLYLTEFDFLDYNFHQLFQAKQTHKNVSSGFDVTKWNELLEFDYWDIF